MSSWRVCVVFGGVCRACESVCLFVVCVCVLDVTWLRWMLMPSSPVFARVVLLREAGEWPYVERDWIHP